MYIQTEISSVPGCRARYRGLEKGSEDGGGPSGEKGTGFSRLLSFCSDSLFLMLW